MATTKLIFQPNLKLENERTGLIVMGQSYASLVLRSEKDGIKLVYVVCKKAYESKPEEEKVISPIKTGSDVYLRVVVTEGAKCQFSYSLDGQRYTKVGEPFTAEVGRWIGAKMGLFCTRTTQTNDSGYADFDWFRVEPVSVDAP